MCKEQKWLWFENESSIVVVVVVCRDCLMEEREGKIKQHISHNIITLLAHILTDSYRTEHVRLKK